MLARLKPADPLNQSQFGGPFREKKFLPPVALSFFSRTHSLLFAVSVGQNREKFVISARAGGINAITGGATVTSRGGDSEWQQLMITDDLNSGDRVRTAVRRAGGNPA